MPLAVIIATLFISIGAVDLATGGSSIPSTSVQTESRTVVGEILPSQIRIPALGIITQVEHVGVTEQGRMQASKRFENVAWYALGSRPGSSGSAVFAGHLDNGLGMPGVFAHLGKATEGDRIYVRDIHGLEKVYEVVRTASYGLYDAPSEDIFRTSGEEVLVLITCDGKWVASDKTYDRRLVVFAKPLNLIP